MSTGGPIRWQPASCMPGISTSSRWPCPIRAPSGGLAEVESRRHVRRRDAPARPVGRECGCLSRPQQHHDSFPLRPESVQRQRLAARNADLNTPQYTVWGCKRPELLITETLAFHDRRTQDLNNEVFDKHEAPVVHNQSSYADRRRVTTTPIRRAARIPASIRSSARKVPCSSNSTTPGRSRSRGRPISAPSIQHRESPGSN